MRRILAISAIIGFLCCVASCPGGHEQQKSGQNNTPATTPVPGPDAGEGACPTEPASTEAEQAKDVPTGEDSAVAGDNLVGTWIKPVAEKVKMRQPFKVEYHIVPAPNDDAWLALVPAAITSKLMSDNMPQAVDRVTLPQQESGVVELKGNNPGAYCIRLFPSQLGEVMAVAEATIVLTDQPLEDELVLVAPYVTITGKKLEKTPEHQVKLPIIAYWELTDIPSDSAWIGLVPTSCTTTDAKSNLEAAVDVQFLGQQIKACNTFMLKQLGEFAFRVFPSDDPAAQMICESQVFKVVPKPEQKAPVTE